MTSIHVQEHKEMLELAEAILASATNRPAPCGDAIAKLRLRFARLVNRHCDEEGAMIRDAVRSGALCATRAGAMHRELTDWRAALTLLNCDWPGDRVARDASGFASCFRVLADSLRRYIAREESEILAYIARA